MIRIYRNFLVTTLLLISSSYGWKDIAHYISAPLIEGAGLYSSIASLSEAELAGTKVAAITNISLLATNATLGLVTAISPKESYPKIRRFHRIIGFAVTAAALGLSITASIDDGVEDAPQYVSYGYTALSVVPLVIFKF